jgi:DNA-binding beta-propeller fold protein YncE
VSVATGHLGQGPGTGEGQFEYISGLAVDDQGNAYVADFNNVRTQKFDRSGKFLAQWPTEQPAGPVGVALDASGNVYVVNHRTHTHYVQKFDSAGHLLLAWGSTGTGPGEIAAGSTGGPEGIAIDPAAHVYVGDLDNSRVQEFTANGQFLSTFGSLGFGEGKFIAGPLGVAVDASGNIFATQENGTIQEFDPSGRFLANGIRPVLTV